MEKIRFRDKMAAAEAGTPVEEQDDLPLSPEAEKHLQAIESEKLRYSCFDVAWWLIQNVNVIFLWGALWLELLVWFNAAWQRIYKIDIDVLLPAHADIERVTTNWKASKR